MSIHLRILLSALCLISMTSVASATKINGLGNDYEVYDFGNYSDNVPWYQDFATPTDPPNNNWYVPAHNYKNPVYLYELNPSLVQTQMKNMRNSGIDVLVLHISTSDLATCEANGACPTPYNDGIWGYITDVSQSALRPQQAQNLVNIVNYAAQIGFRKVFLRFDDESASGNATWNETAYQKVWNFIYSTHNLAANALKYTATRLLVDLGGEQIGTYCGSGQQCPGLKAYVSRLWSDYTYAFGITDTVGFSFIGCNWIVQNGLPWYGQTKPQQYAFDVYGGNGCSTGSTVQSNLVASWQALGSEKVKPIMIMETYFNDSTTASQVSAAISANPTMNVTDVVQWPVTRTPSCSTCDQNIQTAPLAALGTTSQVSNYLSLAATGATDNLNPSLLNVDASSCTSTSSTTCARFNVGYAPANGLNNWQIWVTADNGARKLWGCNAGVWSGASALTAGWMVKGYSYRFDYYKVSSCSATPPLGSQSATSYISFR